MLRTFFLILSLAIIIVGSSSIYIINEREQAVVTQFGKPVGEAITEAGLHFKTPLIQRVIKFDKRILQWDGSAKEIPTFDNKYIIIDAFARWKISDALQFYKSAKNEMLAQSRLDDIIDGAVRDEISNRFMSEIIRSSDRKMEVYDTAIESDENIEEFLKEEIKEEKRDYIKKKKKPSWITKKCKEKSKYLQKKWVVI